MTTVQALFLFARFHSKFYDTFPIGKRQQSLEASMPGRSLHRANSKKNLPPDMDLAHTLHGHMRLVTILPQNIAGVMSFHSARPLGQAESWY